MTVLAIGDRTNNAELIQDCHQLGYINGDTIDLTYGQGAFWRLYRPDNLTTNDRFTDDADWHDDFRHTSWTDDAFDTVIFDPPYKLNGTSTGRGPAAADRRYGVHTGYQPITDKHQHIFDGITEALRILRPGGHLLVKCQDQVSSGKVHWQTIMFATHSVTAGAALVDMLHVQGHRAQPPGRRQLHARRDYSTLLVHKKGTPQ